MSDISKLYGAKNINIHDNSGEMNTRIIRDKTKINRREVKFELITGRTVILKTNNFVPVKDKDSKIVAFNYEESRGSYNIKAIVA